jgi:hypothetical protein
MTSRRDPAEWVAWQLVLGVLAGLVSLPTVVALAALASNLATQVVGGVSPDSGGLIALAGWMAGLAAVFGIWWTLVRVRQNSRSFVVGFWWGFVGSLLLGGGLCVALLSNI